MDNLWVEFIGSKLFRGLVLLALAVAWWFGLYWFLEMLGMDPKVAFLIWGFTRVVGTLILGVWGAACVMSALTR